MRDKRFYQFLHRQIPVFILLSLLPGLGYLFLGWLNKVFTPAFIWYLLIVALSIWGYRLYLGFDYSTMSDSRRDRWYRQCSWFFYSFFLLWTLIFLIYVFHQEKNLHYIAIFTEIGASVVASSLLSSDRRLYRPTVLILMIPLIIYFFLIGEWYGYVLALFACTFTWVLLYSANSSYQLLKQANHQATHDALTGLRNRQFFIDHLQARMNSVEESGEYSYLLLIDLDHFKTVNDSLGHDVGDRLLQSVVARLQQYTPAECVIARLGGDEFIITGVCHANLDECKKIALETAELLISKLKENYVIEQHHLYISASIGVSIISGLNTNANRYIKEADIAMYEVKAKGRDGVIMFDQAMSERIERKLEIERLLHFAISNNEISLNFQPQMGATEKIIGAEVLARWSSPSLGQVPPAEFITIAEQTGLIIELGKHILECGFRTLREWHNGGITLDQFSINISMMQFTHHTFVPLVEELIQRYLDDALCQKLVFEVTESIVAEDINRVIMVMNKLKSYKIRFSMDDFGTGYSSLSHLNKLPLDEIKIDRSFVSALGDNVSDREMIMTILNMAHILKLKIVAEGVETPEQHDFLFNNNCHIFQGYFYARPLTDIQFLDYYRSRNQSGTFPVK